MNKTKTK